ncbi:hypothetical protein MMC28_004991 [Mycoblastus sanguinarius]|nr:hypothetical protein [Mycoblastus sanguinarius]
MTLFSTNNVCFRAITLLVLCLFLPTTAQQQTILIPKGNGSYDTRITTAKLVDETRNDPFAPSPTPRAIMVSVFFPVKDRQECGPLQTVDYMPPATAQFEDQMLSAYGLPNGTLERFGLAVCGSQNTTVASPSGNHRSGSYPVVLFSPGLGASRLTYSAIAQSVASFGYLVVTIDHPYDADIVEFPDGSLVFAFNISTQAQLDLAIQTRAQDASFVLDQLSAANSSKELIPGVGGQLNISHVAMFGHSLGGAATASAMLSDSRIVGGLNMDGTLYGPVVEAGLDRPFLFFNRPNHTRFSDDSWAEIWPLLRSWKLDLNFANFQHDTFTDFPLLVHLLGLDPLTATGIGSVLGTVDGARALSLVGAYVVAFLDFVLKGAQPAILQRPSPLYPEVTFVN